MIKKIFLLWQGSVRTQRKSFFSGKVQKEGNYFFPVVVLIGTSLSWERNCSRLLGQCSIPQQWYWHGTVYGRGQLGSIWLKTSRLPACSHLALFLIYGGYPCRLFGMRVHILVFLQLRDTITYVLPLYVQQYCTTYILRINLVCYKNTLGNRHLFATVFG